jgi:hypothetical protein
MAQLRAQLTQLRVEAMLERLNTIEEEEHSVSHHRLGDRLGRPRGRRAVRRRFRGDR